MSKAIFLAGPPGCGKTTLMRRIVGVTQTPTGGFYTQEIREQGVRKGFEIITLDGQRGILAHVGIRSTNRVSEYGVDISVLDTLGVKTLFIERGSPWENGYIESFNGKMRDELLDREIFYTLREAQILIEDWRRQYNTLRPHSALNYRPPAPEAILVPPPPGRAWNLT